MNNGTWSHACSILLTPCGHELSLFHYFCIIDYVNTNELELGKKISIRCINSSYRILLQSNTKSNWCYFYVSICILSIREIK